MSFTMKTLTEGIRQRHMGAQHQRLTEKWNRTGLLRGLQGYNRENMAVMLENQAAQLLRETNTLGASSGPASSGDIRGFQNVAFPIVRRVFGGLVANELVSIQPMSLPSGLLFYLDYTYGSDVGGIDSSTNADDSAGYEAGKSIYNQPTGKGIQSGSLGIGGQYDLLGSGYSRRHTSIEMDIDKTLSSDTDWSSVTMVAGDLQAININATTGAVQGLKVNGTNDSDPVTELTGAIGRLVDFDSELQRALNDGRVGTIGFLLADVDDLVGTSATDTDGSTVSFAADLTMLQDILLVPGSATTNIRDQGDLDAIPDSLQPGSNVFNFRRHTKRVRIGSDNIIKVDPLGGTHVLFVVANCDDADGIDFNGVGANCGVSFPISSRLSVGANGDALTIPTFESPMNAFDPNPKIPEIDIKIESLAVTAVSRKLKAKWSPELAQDLNAYHSLDAEVELTQILSEQIALELDREVLNDLLTQANGANLFWSRAPGKFVNKLTGVEVPRNTSLRPGPQFTGTVRDWYETLVETIIDAANIIHRKTLRGSANFIVIGPDVATIFESSVMYKPSYSIDGQGQASALSIGAEKIGNLSNRFTVYKDPYFPRNKVLIGYKGGSYLETGYVYAPYVPLIVTPTIFAPEDFTPRKGVMTRYGKKMVRSDFYGTVTCLDMNII